MDVPAVTVVMPAYEASAFVGDAIRSVLAQTYRSFELLVVDDGSTDATAEVARNASAGDPRVHVTSVAHAGPARARNVALAAARGRVLAFLDADDAWEPDHLATMVPALDASPGRFAYANATVVGDGPEEPAHFAGYAPAASFRDLYLVSHIPSPGAVVVRTEDARAIGGFGEDEAWIGSEDRAFYLSLCLRGVLPTYVPHRSVRYRVHPGQLTRRPVKQLRAKRAVRRHFRDAVDATGARAIDEAAADALLAAIETDLAYALASTDVDEALGLFAEAKRRDPRVAQSERAQQLVSKVAFRRWVSLPSAGSLPPLRGAHAWLAVAFATLLLAAVAWTRWTAFHGPR